MKSLKKICACGTLLIPALFALPSKAEIDLGVLAGVQLKGFQNERQLGDLTIKTRSFQGWYIGPKINISLSAFGIDAALLYNQRNYQDIAGSETKYQNLDIPVNFRYTAELGGIGDVYFAAGPQLSYTLDKDLKTELKNKFSGAFRKERRAYSVNLGAGIKAGGNIEVGVVYNIPVTKDFKFFGMKIKDRSYTNKPSFRIQCAYMF